LDNPNPDFNKYYDFEATFPGCPPLVVEAVDYDDIFGDDVIGTTNCDLEDRFFSPEWQSLKNKPVEYRQLYHHSSAVSQGVFKMWIEIHPTSIPANEIPVYDLTPRPIEDFEVRVVIWDTIDIPCMDVEGTSDIYCRGFFDSKEETHETDTHYRCQNGKGSFNYRLIYNVKHPRKDYNYTLQVYDRDFFKSNDIIGEAIINLANVFEDAGLSKRTLDLDKVYYEAYLKGLGGKYDFKDEKSFWVPIMGINDKGETVTNGKVRISISVLPIV
jgi:C2 domain